MSETDYFYEFLLEGEFEGYRFPVSGMDTETSHDAVLHKAYARPGADVEACGLNPDHGSLSIPFFNDIQGYGPLFPEGYRRLLALVKAHPIGDFVHPTRGRMRAHVAKLRERFDPEIRGGVSVVLEWIEHDATIQARTRDVVRTYSDTTYTHADAAAQRADDAMEAFDPGNAGGWTPVRPTLMRYLEGLETGVATFALVQHAARQVLKLIEEDAGLEIFLPAAAHEVALALTECEAAVYALLDHYQPDRALLGRYEVPRDMAIWEVAHAVYGDSSLTSLITAANVIRDPLEIRRGTVLVILPKPSV